MCDYNETEDEYMADEYDMDDLEDEMNAEFDARDIDASDSEVEDFEQLVCLIIIIIIICLFLGVLIDNNTQTICTYGMFQNKAADTSAAQARNGKDIQGIPWERLSVTRKDYRKTRLEQYKNYENVPHSGEEAGKVTYLHFMLISLGDRYLILVLLYWNQHCTDTEKGSSFYTFRSNSRSVRSTILHFQVCQLSHHYTLLCFQ